MNCSEFKLPVKNKILNPDELIVGCKTPTASGSPLYPEFNVDWVKKEIDTLSQQSQREGARMELLPHHRLGESKYERLGRSYEMEDIPNPSKEEMEKAAAVLRGFRINLVKR